MHPFLLLFLGLLGGGGREYSLSRGKRATLWEAVVGWGLQQNAPPLTISLAIVAVAIFRDSKPCFRTTSQGPTVCAQAPAIQLISQQGKGSQPTVLSCDHLLYQLGSVQSVYLGLVPSPTLRGGGYSKQLATLHLSLGTWTSRLRLGTRAERLAKTPGV